jgi:hypothetical protein
MNPVGLNNIKNLNTKQLESLLHSREQAAFYSTIDFPKTKEDFAHNKSISDGIKEIKDEISLRNMVAVFGKRDIVL